MPDTSEGLVDTDLDLSVVLENGALEGACEAYFEKGQTDRKTMLLCGKWMFFYEGFSTAGVPTLLPKVLLTHFEDVVGPGFEKLGMIADPSSADGMPLGLSPGGPFGKLDTMAFTCASCHFAKLPDGRYSVGAPNHAYEYGKHNLMMAVFPLIALAGGEQNHDPDAVAVIQPLLDKVAADPALKQQITMELLPIATAGAPTPVFPKEAEAHYANWLSGTMDFIIEPLPLNDKVHTISKISPIWGIPGDEEVATAKMPHAMLGWTGGTRSVKSFVSGFVSFGGGDVAAWPEERLAPLVEYVSSLRAPANPTPPDATLAGEGEALFADKCLSCHDGPRGSGKKVYSYDEIGTDDAMKYWLDPEQTGEACCDAPVTEDEPLTHGIKSPRIVGLWSMKRFLHNGSVGSLADLFCKSGPRGGTAEPAYGDGGHDYTCDGLSDHEKDALIAYLLSH